MARQQRGYVDRTRDFLKQEKVKYFIGGAIATVAIGKILETEIAHNAAVSATAGILNLKDSVEEKILNLQLLKKDLFNLVIGNEAELVSKLTLNELLSLFND